jgi:replicative DNA helicase
MSNYELDPEFLERLILKTMLQDKQFLITISSVFEPEYFDDPTIAKVFEYSSEYVDKYNSLPEKSSIIHSIEDSKSVKDLLEDITAIDFDIADKYKFIFDSTNEYLKTQALKKAIIESVDIVDSNSNKEVIREKIEAALSKDLSIDLGLKYFTDLGERLKRIFTVSNNRLPSYFPMFDELISGGFPPYTLSVLIARIHAGKSNMLANIAARQVLHGHNVVLMTLEMSEDAFAQRFDSIYSLMDINRMYISEEGKKKLITNLSKVKGTEGRGELFIKQFPTGEASIRDFRKYLRELLIRDIKPSILMADYINLMKAATRSGDNLYTSVKRISEELRSLSFEFKVPVISVSQLNREGSFVGFEELDFTYIAESLGLAATSDFLAILGFDEDAAVYENEIHCKIPKNRLGRVGEVFKLYLDARTLKIYDESEIDLWVSDSNISGDERNAYQRVERQQANNGGRRSRR